MKVIFVGSNPSRASKTILPFYGDTKSDYVLSSWAKHLPYEVEMSVCNVMDAPTPNNKPLSVKEIKECLANLANKVNGQDRIIALGKTAAKALTLLHLEFYEMPHPSGRNRLLNDKNYVEEKIKGMLEFCSSIPSSK